MRPARPVRALLAPLLACAFALPPASTASAQIAFAPARCLDTLSAGSLRRVPVYLEPTSADSGTPQAASTLQLFADDAATRLRRLLTTAAATLPTAPADVRWRGVTDADVDVALRRDGTAEVRPAAPEAAEGGHGGAPRVADPGALALLLRVVRATADSSGPFFWEGGDAGAPLRFRVGFVHPEVDSAGTVARLASRFAVPVFTLPVPWSAPVRTLVEPRMVYPRDALQDNTVGTVVLAFVVEPSGLVDTATVRDVWPAHRPRLKGLRGEHYQRFVQAGARALSEARFAPARLSGCPVRARVSQPMLWRITPRAMP